MSISSHLFLHGKRIVLTRPQHQTSAWEAALTRLGAHVVLYPVLAIQSPQQPAPFKQAIEQALEGRFSWIVFSSANTVHAIKKQLDALGGNGQLPTHVKLAAVGNVTAKAIEQQLRKTAHFVAPRPNGQCLGQTLPLQGEETILLPQAQNAQPNLQQALQQRSRNVCVVTAYRSVPHCPPQNPMEVFCPLQGLCVVCFTSGSSVTACLAALQKHRALALLNDCIIACVGQSSIQTATQKGLSVGIACYHATLESLVYTLRKRFA
ncbi:MAG: uroporphyrinogen-III synthase [Myxococcota bacterium]